MCRLRIDIIADILLNPTFDETELDRESGVVIQEIGQTRDTPDDLIFDYLQEACYPGQPMGWPILGTEKTVGGMSRKHLSDFISANYHADGMMLAAAGAVDHAHVVELAEELFAKIKNGGQATAKPARFSGGDKREADDLEQAHLAFAFPGVASADPDIFVAQVFTTALGGGMSSRLFQEAREKRGLCYAIYAFTQSYRDTGMIGIYSGTSDKERARSRLSSPTKWLRWHRARPKKKPPAPAPSSRRRC